MSGFCKIALIGEHFGNSIVNVLHYRSSEWLPLQGNPFDDSLAFLDAVLLHLQAKWLEGHTADYRLLRAEAVGYDDAYTIVTSSPLIRTVNVAGDITPLDTTGSFISANIGLRCGEQTQINGIGKSKRNRGYMSIGPVNEASVDSYGHITTTFSTSLENIAEKLDDPITAVLPAVTLTPIRIHEKWLVVGPLKTLVLRTYSDVLGYTLPRVASVRRSRMTEA